MTAAGIRLVILSGANAGASLVPRGGQGVIGRAPDCDLRFDPHRDEGVSRQHARVFLRGAQWFIEDLGSGNGVRPLAKPLAGRQFLGSKAVLALPGGLVLLLRSWGPQPADGEVACLRDGVALRTARFSGQPLVVGTDSSCALIVPMQSGLSAHHLRLEREGDDWWAEPLAGAMVWCADGPAQGAQPLLPGSVWQLSAEHALGVFEGPAASLPPPEERGGGGRTPRHDEAGRRRSPRSQESQRPPISTRTGVLRAELSGARRRLRLLGAVVAVLAVGWVAWGGGMFARHRARLRLEESATEVWTTFTDVEDLALEQEIAEQVEAHPEEELTNDQEESLRDLRRRRLEALRASLEASASERRWSRWTATRPFAYGSGSLGSMVQSLVSELTGAPSHAPVPDGFLEVTARQIRNFLGDQEGYCRMKALEPELRTLLTREFERLSEGRSNAARDARNVESLVQIAWVESRFCPTACSHVGARGMWQFMPPTARLPTFGIEVSDLRDQRCNWRFMTPMAARYFHGTLRSHGSRHPFLAIAAYNTSPSRVRRAAAALDADPEVSDDLKNYYLFYARAVEAALPNETRHYVAKFVAAAIVARDPDAARAALARFDPSGRAIDAYADCPQPGTREFWNPPSVDCRGEWRCEPSVCD